MASQMSSMFATHNDVVHDTHTSRSKWICNIYVAKFHFATYCFTLGFFFSGFFFCSGFFLSPHVLVHIFVTNEYFCTKFGFQVQLKNNIMQIQAEGHRSNLKVTRPESLLFFHVLGYIYAMYGSNLTKFDIYNACRMHYDV